jgi:hypothetical protein
LARKAGRCFGAVHPSQPSFRSVIATLMRRLWHIPGQP